MVESQFRLVTEHLKLDHLLAVSGASMGGMQTLQWGVSHPDFMDALIDGDPSATAALKDPSFMAILQQKMKEENQLATMISNLIDVQHRTSMASITNMRV